ncbi:DUF1254 domain-containing protein [Nocardioides nitrophenolicus]|uniref:DUF1254 domain-containing protein n=1 Tax=Nocardioides nitrophenolicus TaxID=60489 RepID=UPI001956F03E|nr:DUF1254 domain-containing protein [Nocardioides nitrophenolicus]MBM7518502.1 hypothetical protein [Nocardioides nitrophenolicus]
MSYVALDLGSADQIQASRRPDLVPRDPAARRTLARQVAFDAVVYGLTPAFEYAQLCRQHAEDGRAFGRFVHERRLAAPGFAVFRAPNVDTLYSTAWLDLREGPAVIELPDFGERYFTLHLLDFFGNGANLSRRTIGTAREIWLVAPGDEVRVPAGAARIAAAARVVWVLMRIQVSGDEPEVHALQDAVVLRAPSLGAEPRPADRGRGFGPRVDPTEVETSWAAFLRAMDGALRLGGVPDMEQALVSRFGLLGLAGEAPVDPDRLDAAIQEGAAQGFADAMGVLDACRPQLGERVATGWTKVCDKGAHGVNYLSRSVMNLVGLAANVVEENTSYNTYVDVDGVFLDGATSDYLLRLDRQPPARAFWSVTMYDGEGLLVANPIDRYAVGSATPGLVVDPDGGVSIAISPDRPAEGNWLPAPRGRFFLALRMYEPLPEALDGVWTPGAVQRRDAVSR